MVGIGVLISSVLLLGSRLTGGITRSYSIARITNHSTSRRAV